MRIELAGLIMVATGAAGVASFLACSETGPGAPPRQNGCIDVGCDDPGSSSSGGSSGAGGEGGARGDGEGGVARGGDPLQGTSKAATLVRGRLRFTEGPVWIGGRLLFTDIPSNRILELQPDGGTNDFRGNSGGANGLAVDDEGNLVVCEGNAKRLSRSPARRDAPAELVAGTYAEQAFNSPNDVVVRADGNIYFTDPSYSAEPDTQDDEAVYRIAPGGALTRLEQDFQKPNGIALSPDGRTLYVVDNGAGKLFASSLDASGGVLATEELASVPGGDGMAVDDDGNLYVADGNGIDVFDARGAKRGTVTVDVKPTNCTFGGADRRTLYITANGPEPGDGGRNPKTGLYMIRLNVPGLP